MTLTDKQTKAVYLMGELFDNATMDEFGRVERHWRKLDSDYLGAIYTAWKNGNKEQAIKLIQKIGIKEVRSVGV